ncbi:hypothetical protein FO488_04335 [Geobacter sp. FeAm09]|uniref:hypothetical protein n=1 Tax=Geobacter sp. FeAm09 TaxID=2597769 RepID=UPI0011EDE1BD|nr:hypothetical protein [Geobacter sp. FeAm09]QEM67444.1 hypothetical protein FO488_04335 [Geobacter sp. FeAm09]
MFGKIIIAILLGISCASLSGCLHRGNVAPGPAGAAGTAAGPTAAAPTIISGTVLREDRVTPVSDVHVVLRKKTHEAPPSSAYTDHIGNFSVTEPFDRGDYSIEIDSPEYVGGKTILVEPGRDNWHEIIVYKR